jgi:hypothetical protein
MLITSIPQYIQGLTNAKLLLTTTDATVLYTAPSGAEANSSVISSILVHEHSNNNDTVRVFITDIDNNIFEMFDKTVAGHATTELLTRDLVLQAGESISMQAGTANRIHIVASIQEFIKTRISTSALSQI